MSLSVPFFDTHLHLDTGETPGDLFRDAAGVDVTQFLLAGTELPNSIYVAEIAKTEVGVVTSAGIHPHEATSFEDLAPFRELLSRPEVVAIGEIGLDYHYNHSPVDVQRQVFSTFLELSIETGCPAIIHCREAFDDCLAILRDAGPDLGAFEVHSFTGTPAQAEIVLGMGGYLSFNGMVTFRKADNIREALAAVPVERLLLETDSPWLAPAPHRGKRNAPAYIPLIAEEVARLKGIPVAELAEQTTRNAEKLFGLRAK